MQQMMMMTMTFSEITMITTTHDRVAYVQQCNNQATSCIIYTDPLKKYIISIIDKAQENIATAIALRK